MSDVPIKEYVDSMVALQEKHVETLFELQDKNIERSLQALNESRHRRETHASLLLSAALLVMAIATLVLAFWRTK